MAVIQKYICIGRNDKKVYKVPEPFPDKKVKKVLSFCATRSDSRGNTKVDTGCKG